jgi:hypothetical protein
VSNTYFTDRDLGKKFPQILVDAGLAVERHGDLFSPDGSDEQWLEYCGKNGRIAVTHNQRIRYTPNELAAVVRYRVALLVVIGHAPFPELARHFVNSIRRIETFVDAHEPPFIAKVYRAAPADVARNATAAGSVSLWYPA